MAEEKIRAILRAALAQITEQMATQNEPIAMQQPIQEMENAIENVCQQVNMLTEMNKVYNLTHNLTYKSLQLKYRNNSHIIFSHYSHSHHLEVEIRTSFGN